MAAVASELCCKKMFQSLFRIKNAPGLKWSPLNKQLVEEKVPHTITLIQHQIEAIDQQIDKLVYELYGLTDKEIMIIEEGC